MSGKRQYLTQIKYETHVKIKRVFKLLFTICIISILIYLPACQKNSANINKEIIDNLQKNVPFKIVIPTYIPVGINPVIAGLAGPSEYETTNSTSLGLIYYGKSDDIFIWVSEENREGNPVPNEPFSIFVINNIKIFEEINVSLRNPEKSKDNISIKDVLLYRWDQNGIFFNVNISGYDKIEARKVIESMIK
jgi:hypothetical protein